MISGLETGEVGLLWIAATNPAVSMPDLERTKAALKQSPFTVYQDAYYPTETSAYAHILLPAAQWSEKSGVMTNSERRVTLCPAFRHSLERQRQTGRFCRSRTKMGFAEQFQFSSAAEVCAEFVALTRDRPAT
jgi:ferredoxin-nitrate reductase